MGGPSLAGFLWFRFGGAKIEKGRLLAPVSHSPDRYRPAEFLPQLLTAVQQVRDEETALEFAHRWGPLGLSQDVDKLEKALQRNFAAYEFAMQHGLPWWEANERVDRMFPLPEKGDPLERVLWFAEWTRHVSTIRRLLANFEDESSDEPDPWGRAEAWLATLSPQWQFELFGTKLESLREDYGTGGWAQDSFEHYAVAFALHWQRLLFSDGSRRGVWVGLHTFSYNTKKPEGQPVLHFDALFRFIEYSLLVHGGVPEPVRCADPKCGALFFPSRKGQRYCPPPPGARRSRCENRAAVERWRRRRG